MALSSDGKPDVVTVWQHYLGCVSPSERTDVQVDIKKLAAEGGLGRLTIPQLKDACAAYGLKKTGKKDELVERIWQHVMAS